MSLCSCQQYGTPYPFASETDMSSSSRCWSSWRAFWRAFSRTRYDQGLCFSKKKKKKKPAINKLRVGDLFASTFHERYLFKKMSLLINTLVTVSSSSSHASNPITENPMQGADHVQKLLYYLWQHHRRVSALQLLCPKWRAFKENNGHPGLLT